MEARGFILAAPVALALGVGFVPVRKAGKLPRADPRRLLRPGVRRGHPRDAPGRARRRASGCCSSTTCWPPAAPPRPPASWSSSAAGACTALAVLHGARRSCPGREPPSATSPLHALHDGLTPGVPPRRLACERVRGESPWLRSAVVAADRERARRAHRRPTAARARRRPRHRRRAPPALGRSRMRARLARIGTKSQSGNPVLEPLFRAVRANHPKADLALLERAYLTAEQHAPRARCARAATPTSPTRSR